MAVCSFAITYKDDKILLVKLTEAYAFAGYWNFPGGVVEDGEGLEESAKREVLEETGIIINVGNKFDSFSTLENEINLYIATYVSGDITIQESEITEARWFNIQDALKLPHAYNTGETIQKLKLRGFRG